MSIFSFIKGWGNNLSQLSDSDRMVSNLVGINPKNYHPKVYQSVIRFAQDIQEEFTRSGKAPLSVAEFSIVRIAFMAGIADKSEDYSAAQKYVDAIGRLRRSCPNDIRMDVGWKIDDICNELHVQDSNPAGENRP